MIKEMKMRALKFYVLAPCVALLATAAGAEIGSTSTNTTTKPTSMMDTAADLATTKSSDLHQVSGKILRVKQVEVRGADTKNTVVLLKTKKNNRRLAVDLGPASSLAADKIKVGREIQVEGMPAQIRDQRFLVANRVKINGKMMTIDRKAQETQHKSDATTPSLETEDQGG
jgi:hypothetical protein